MDLFILPLWLNLSTQLLLVSDRHTFHRLLLQSLVAFVSIKAIFPAENIKRTLLSLSIFKILNFRPKSSGPQSRLSVTFEVFPD